jgi:sugar-specific transcriptional regulator TrmB
MKKSLTTLGLNEKQTQVFMYLVEYGISPASEIAKSIDIPKSTVNFLADTLWQQ